MGQCTYSRTHSEPIARASGCSVVRTYCGHGINDLFHCAPNVPHYAKNKAIGTMRVGQTFTIEPVRVSFVFLCMKGGTARAECSTRR